MNHNIYKVAGNVKPLSTTGNYGMVINFPLTASCSRCYPFARNNATGLAWKSKEAVVQMYTYGIHMLWVKEGQAFFLSITPSC